jgi:hypothetical protein
MKRRDLIVLSIGMAIISVLWLLLLRENGAWDYVQTMASCLMIWFAPDLVRAGINILAPEDDTTANDFARSSLWVVGAAGVLAFSHAIWRRPLDTGYFVALLVFAAILALRCLWRAGRRMQELNGDGLEEVEEPQDDPTLRRVKTPSEIEASRVPDAVDGMRKIPRAATMFERAEHGEIEDYNFSEAANDVQGHRSTSRN